VALTEEQEAIWADLLGNVRQVLSYWNERGQKPADESCETVLAVDVEIARLRTENERLAGLLEDRTAERDHWMRSYHEIPEAARIAALAEPQP
jgi:hypothetical protein